eukprot:2870466-Prymnesium_polylepis.3
MRTQAAKRGHRHCERQGGNFVWSVANWQGACLTLARRWKRDLRLERERFARSAAAHGLRRRSAARGPMHRDAQLAMKLMVGVVR